MVWIESWLILAALGGSFIFPRLGAPWFEAMERSFDSLARRRGLAVLVVGLVAVAARAALLPILPIPTPLAGDEFSYLLGADTLLHERLANPPHPMWFHFETVDAIGHPTYTAVHPPAQAAFLAAGQVIAGHPFWGVWLSVGLMCAAVCWMLQGWLPPGWALLGGFVAVIRLGTFSYWANSYWGGAVAALGGALVLGALPRLKRCPRVGAALLMGLGLALLANSRPYEGFFFSLPVAVALLVWVLGKNRPAWPVLVRRVVAPLAFVLLLITLQIGYYNWRVTGSALRFPYHVAVAGQMARQMIWQAPMLGIRYHSQFLTDYFANWVLPQFLAARTPGGFALSAVEKLLRVWFFYLWPLLTFPLLTAFLILPIGFSWRQVDTGTKFLLSVGATAFVGLQLDVFFSPHYAAPLTGLILAFVLIALRRVRAWQWRGTPSGLFLSRAFPVIAVVMLGLRAAAVRLHLPLPDPTSLMWCSPREPDFGRTRVLKQFEATPGRHLVLVRYGPEHSVFIDWVHNDADIDGSKVVWARDMRPAENEELIRYFKGRRVWLLEADERPPRLTPYGAAPAQ